MTVEGAEPDAAGWGEGFAGVRPFERMRHRPVIVVDEQSQLDLQVGDGKEHPASHQFAADDPEGDLDLVEPRTVFRGVHEPDPVARQ